MFIPVSPSWQGCKLSICIDTSAQRPDSRKTPVKRLSCLHNGCQPVSSSPTLGNVRNGLDLQGPQSYFHMKLEALASRVKRLLKSLWHCICLRWMLSCSKGRLGAISYSGAVLAVICSGNLSGCEGQRCMKCIFLNVKYNPAVPHKSLNWFYKGSIEVQM